MLRRRICSVLWCVAALLAAAGAADAQSLGGLLPQSSPGSLPQGVRQDGLYMTSPITIDGVPVLRVAVPVSDANAAVDVDARAQAIETAIQQLLTVEGAGAKAHTLYNPKAFRVDVRPARDEALLAASDGQHTAQILTVTSVDAKYQRKTVAALAAQWQRLLRTQLVAALQKRQPAEVRQNSTVLAIVAAALAAITVIIWICITLLGRRLRALKAQVEANERAIGAAGERAAQGGESTRSRRRFLGLLARSADPAQRLHTVSAVRSTLILLLLLAWFIAIVWALLLFAQTTSLGYQLVRHVLRIAVVWFAALLLMRGADAIIARVARAYGRSATGAQERTRRLLRAPTISRTSTGFATFVIIFVATLSSIGQLGLSLGSVLTIGGVLALGVSLAAQNLVRDFLNGFLVIVEDQFVVGDFVTINGTSGVVEHMTLRIVQVRDSGGNLITIPHSTATGVTNSSRNWSRVDYTIPIAPDSDSEKALRVLTKAIESLAAEKDWSASFVEPVEWSGVDSMWRDGIVLRVSIKTAPLQQFRLRREINARVLAAFSKNGIALGINPGGQAVALLPPLT
jgi:small conductance mechanosensitive channel